MTPGPLHQIGLLLGLSVRRWLNRITSGAAAKRSARDAGVTMVRPPTPRRRVGMGLMMVVSGCMFFCYMLAATWLFSSEVKKTVVQKPPSISDLVWREMKATSAEDGKVNHDYISAVINVELRDMGVPISDRPAKIAATIECLQRAQRSTTDDPAIRLRIADFAGALLALIAVWVLAMVLRMSNTDLAKPDWDELWLATQPVSSGILYTARLLQYTLINPLVWGIIPAVTIMLAGYFGMTWTWAIVLGLAAGVLWAVNIAAIRLVTETWLRHHLTHARIKDLQAVATLLGIAMMVTLSASVLSLPSWFVDVVSAFPWSKLPTGWVAAVIFDSHLVYLLLPGAVIFTGGVAVAAVHCCDWWSRSGLVAHAGTFSASRGGTIQVWRPLRVLGKDLILVRRDRALFFQVCVVPIAAFSLQFVAHPSLAKRLLSDFQASTTLVVSLGGWVLLNGLRALAFEGQALWILAGAPQSLAHAIRDKAIMWAVFATVCAVLGLTVVTCVVPWPGASAVPGITLTLLGLPILAVIAVSIGAVATDTQSTLQNRPIGEGAVFLFMLLMSMLPTAVACGSAHQQLAMLALLAIIAWALWQRLHDRLPYLFEPVDRPPRTIDLADGAWAAFTFLFLQGLIAAVLVFTGVAAGLAIVLAFGIAGAAAAAIALFWLWRARVPDLLRGVGIRPAAGTSLPMTAAVGIGYGLVAAAAMAGYLAGIQWLAPHVPLLQQALADTQAEPVESWQLVILMVILAPLCEEFIFRGLLFRGLRRDLSLPWAAAASAGVFAIIHPTVSVIPVFGLGLACAIAYERTRWLVAPILVHAVYNAAVLLFRP